MPEFHSPPFEQKQNQSNKKENDHQRDGGIGEQVIEVPDTLPESFKTRLIRGDSYGLNEADPWASPDLHKGHNHTLSDQLNPSSAHTPSHQPMNVRTVSNMTVKSGFEGPGTDATLDFSHNIGGQEQYPAERPVSSSMSQTNDLQSTLR